MRDPYLVLGVPRNATAADIKRAYRRLAKELHPDLHPGDTRVAERFKEVSAAYKILGDKDLRAKFDRGEIGPDGEARPHFRYEYAGGGARPGGTAGGFAGFDLHDDIFSEFSDLFGQFRSGRSRATRGARGADRHYQITVDFLDAAKGAVRRITLPGGKTLDVRIPAGIEDGKQIRLKGQGDPGIFGGASGDALIEVRVAPHPLFKRDGADIRIDLPISLPEAVLGAKVKVPTIDGPVTLSIPRGANSGQVLRLKGKGIAVEGAGRRGDQYVTLQIRLPDDPDRELEALMRRWQTDRPYDPRAGGRYG